MPDRVELAALEHRLLLRTIEQYDALNAEALSRVHIRRTRLYLDEHSELFDDQSPPKRRPRTSRPDSAAVSGTAG